MVSHTLSKLRKLQADARALFHDKGLEPATAGESVAFRQFLHFWVLVGRSFVRNRCPVRASALAYASLLALVPMLAVVASISASLLKAEGDKRIEQFIERFVDSVTPQAPATVYGPGLELAPGGAATAAQDTEAQTTRREVVKRINEFINNIKSGTLGTTGMVALVFVAVMMLSRIEDTFNDIWGVRRGRSWFARIVQYWAAITLGPMLLIVTIALTSGPHLDTVKALVERLPFVGSWLLRVLLKLLPFAILTVGFAVFYALVPNTRVEWRAAFVGGLVGGCLWQLNNEFSVLYVSRVVTNSKIYGSLGMVPVFMIGLYFSWIILLFGAQVAYAFQNRRAYLQEKQVESVNQRAREFVSLRLATEIGRRFQNGEPAVGSAWLAAHLGVPMRLVTQVLAGLVDAQVLVEAAEGGGAFLPARPLDRITVEDVLQALRAGSGTDVATRTDGSVARVRAEFDRVRAAERAAAERVTLLELVHGIGAPPAA